MKFLGRLLLMSPGTDRTPDRPSAERTQRVEGLLASVQETLATLQKLGSQLEQEVARALYQDGAPGGSALATLELENSRLKQALESRAVIEQAKGVIIARTGGSGADAFGVLTYMARTEGIGVRDAAAAVVEAGRADLPAAASSMPVSLVEESQLNPLNPLNEVILTGPEAGEPGSARRRWRLANPSHSSKRDAPRYRSSAF